MDTITDMTTLTHMVLTLMSHSRDGDIMAPTTVKITYLDKNKNTISTSYTLYRIADDVK